MKSRTIIAASLVLAFSAALAFAQYGGKQKQQRPADTKSLEGKKAPDFALQTLDGQDVKLADLKGNVVVLDFWATWCGPCVAAMPHLQELSNNTELKEKGLRVFAVNLREGEDKVKPFIESNQYTLTVPMDREGSVAQSYKVQGIPTQVVIGRNGMIHKVFVGDGGEKLNAAVEQALRAKAPGSAKGPSTKPSEG
jgi:thiol-disulfide isomerase/thioredoxin